MNGDTFDAFLVRQRARCYAKVSASVTRVRRRRRELVALAEQTVVVKGSFGGGPSPRIHHDDGIEFFVRKSTEHC